MIVLKKNLSSVFHFADIYILNLIEILKLCYILYILKTSILRKKIVILQHMTIQIWNVYRE